MGREEDTRKNQQMGEKTEGKGFGCESRFRKSKSKRDMESVDRDRKRGRTDKGKERDAEVKERGRGIEEEKKTEFWVSQEVGRGKRRRGDGRDKIKREREREQRYKKKFIFWNMAGIGNKDRDFWNYIKGFDFISLSETWMDEKTWENWKGRLPKSHERECSYAVKDKNRERAKGGFIIGKKIEWNVKDVS